MSYQDRNIILRQLGYRSYKAYLRSRLWQAIRKRGYLLHGRSCRLCQRKAKTLHHTEYTLEVLRGDELLSLVPLCHRCHRWVEFNPNGTKRTLAESQAWYSRAVRLLNPDCH